LRKLCRFIRKLIKNIYTSKVLLPEPLAPMMLITSPSWAAKDTAQKLEGTETLGQVLDFQSNRLIEISRRHYLSTPFTKQMQKA